MAFISWRFSFILKNLTRLFVVFGAFIVLKSGLRFILYQSGNLDEARYLNVFQWNGSLCGMSVDDNLRANTRFPYSPHSRFRTRSLNFISTDAETDFGRMIFGHIQPTMDGSYRFAISSDDASELWLSIDEEAKNARLICFVGETTSDGWAKPGQFNKYTRQISNKIYLKEGKRYFLEILHTQGDQLAHLQVMWQLPGTNNFTDIPSQVFLGNIENYPGSGMRHHHMKHFHMHSSYHYEPVRKQNIQYLRQFNAVLPQCDPPKARVYKRYIGVYGVHVARVYPDDGSGKIVAKRCIGQRQNEQCIGNKLVDNSTAESIVRRYVKSTLPRNFLLKSIIHLEEYKTIDSDYIIYFVELNVENQNNGELSRISELFWQNITTGKLCNPATRPWAEDTMIYVIVTAKNQGLWVHRFVDSMVHIQEENKDFNIHPIIVDFGNKYFPTNDTRKYFENSKLKQYTVITKTGRFHKTGAINEAAEIAKDPNSIIFQLDLHLDIPVDLMEIVRKRTIQGRLAFAPMLFRLWCGKVARNPWGYWEHLGFGLFGIYKSDWLKFGGMNVKDYGVTWGGEDWDMVDRVLANGIDIQAIRLPGLFHFYHRKEGMWQKNN